MTDQHSMERNSSKQAALHTPEVMVLRVMRVADLLVRVLSSEPREGHECVPAGDCRENVAQKHKTVNSL